MSEQVLVEVGGKSYTGHYMVEKGMLTVSTLTGRKTTQLGGSTPASLARILLRELVEEERKRG